MWVTYARPEISAGNGEKEDRFNVPRNIEAFLAYTAGENPPVALINLLQNPPSHYHLLPRRQCKCLVHFQNGGGGTDFSSSLRKRLRR
jgi:hypothetical protein